MIRHIQTLKSGLVFLIFFSAKTVVAQSIKSNELKIAAERYMAASVAHDYFSGSILIAKDGVPLFSKGYGMANYEHRVPNTTSTVFQIGSLTKQFTSMAIMQLVEQGKLSVTDSIAKYIDNCPDAWKNITIKNLLTHTSGIVNVSSLPDWDDYHSIQSYSKEQLLDLYRNKPLQFKPGEKHKYSNSNYHLLGNIIERITGLDYYAYLDKYIFKPLGMGQTGYAFPRQVIPNRASGYYSVLTSFTNAPYLNIALTYSSGSLRSTLGDMLLWDHALYTTKLVEKETLNEIFTPFKNNYGYGWIIANKFNRKTMSHSGSINGFSSYLFRFPDDKITIIVLCNSDKASATKAAHELSAIVFNQPYKLPEAQPYELLANAYTSKGIEAALQVYTEIKKKYADKIDEELLNDFGYDLLHLNKIKDAIEIFKLNAKENPNSSNTHDSLGEAYLKDGNLQLAAESYKKALELDPLSESAKKALKKIEEKLKAQ
jgi:CubicO group peptidase (beta-lactamase class C family)